MLMMMMVMIRQAGSLGGRHRCGLASRRFARVRRRRLLGGLQGRSCAEIRDLSRQAIDRAFFC